MGAPVSRRLVLGYAVGSLGTGVYLTVPSVLLLYFMTDVLQVRSSLAALAILLPKLIGAGLDPVVGWMSDRTSSRWGRRRPWLLAGALGMGATFVFLFRAPDIDREMGRFAYVLVLFLTSAIFYSLFATPYVAMPAEMSRESGERARITAWRMTFVMGGVILGSAIAPMLISLFGGGREGYGAMSVIIGAACAVAMLTAFGATASAPAYAARTERPGLWHELAVVLKNRAFLRLAAVFVLQTSIFGLVGAFLPYVARHLLKADEGLVGVLLLAMLTAALVSMRIWVAAAARWGSRTALIAASAAHGILSLSLLGLHGAYPLPLLALQFAALGVAYAGLQFLPFAMLTDVIDADRRASGGAREGAFTGLWTAVEKLGLAAGPTLAAGLLASFHYRGGGEMTAATSDLIRYAMALGPGAIQGVSIMLLAGYGGEESGRSRLGSTGGR